LPKNSGATFAISADYVEFVHDMVVSILWPGDQPVGAGEYRNSGLVASAAARPFQTFGGDLFKDPIEKAGALFHSLICSHPFYNGNKRTAVIALDHFLLANGLCLALPQSDMYELARRTATCNESGPGHEAMLKEVTGTLRDHCVSLDEIRGNPEFPNLGSLLDNMRTFIRDHPLNSIQPNT
jgi:death-on-curing protein